MVDMVGRLNDKHETTNSSLISLVTLVATHAQNLTASHITCIQTSKNLIPQVKVEHMVVPKIGLPHGTPKSSIINHLLGYPHFRKPSISLETAMKSNQKRLDITALIGIHPHCLQSQVQGLEGNR
jgi:hypothetical protein